MVPDGKTGALYRYIWYSDWGWGRCSSAQALRIQCTKRISTAVELVLRWCDDGCVWINVSVVLSDISVSCPRSMSKQLHVDCVSLRLCSVRRRSILTSRPTRIHLADYYSSFTLYLSVVRHLRSDIDWIHKYSAEVNVLGRARHCSVVSTSYSCNK